MIAIILVSILMPMTVSAGGSVEKVCAGILTDMRVIGVQIGDCDLNSISPNDFKRITDICGEPGRIDTGEGSPRAETKCRIRAIVVSPHKSVPPENHGYGAPIYVVIKVLKIEKR
jgi:hypothetical protein